MLKVRVHNVASVLAVGVGSALPPLSTFILIFLLLKTGHIELINQGFGKHLAYYTGH